ncbi:hypothetical protein K503DRAFT_768005 [Rhizopogon vinicolor AM-OR11-026]|uniref:Uncharacterized protein n=1 Tax=Rhizopogon vinicolor AM-OR11-026 TaxID=1314800 RepID=A0A1B7N8A3_9AGAM|nr:hypothetical protein K503DRAFT_768005 [Rhizopogon vinicolor AM-OR11-026]
MQLSCLIVGAVLIHISAQVTPSLVLHVIEYPALSATSVTCYSTSSLRFQAF